MMKLNNITQEHVLQALAEIDEKGLRFPLNKSSIYDLVYQGENYPLKHVVAVAHDYANDSYLSHEDFVSKLARELLTDIEPDFKIITKNVDPIISIIEKCKEGIEETKLTDEIYKWNLIEKYQGRPDLNADDFPEEIKSTDYDNLMYGIAKGVINHIQHNSLH